MPADLDELFTDLGRTADAIPLGPAERARRRGRRRNRNAAALVAAVVCLIALGVAVGVRHERRTDHPVAPPGPLPMVGAPLPYGGPARYAVSTVSDGRAFTAWQSADREVRVNATDLRTGAPSWSARTVGRFDELGGVTALAAAVMVVVVPDSSAVPPTGAGPDRTAYVYDPATGRFRWKLAFGVADDLVVHERMLVRMSAATGRTEAFDWVTGDRRWQVPPGADRPRRTMGMRTGDHRAALTDDRLIQVTEAGAVRVRDLGTGSLSATVATLRPPREGYDYLAYDGWLYSTERSGGTTTPFRVVGTYLGGNGPVVLQDVGPGHVIGPMWPCGAGLLCLVDSDTRLNTTVRAINVGYRRQVWQFALSSGATGFSQQGYTLLAAREAALLDPDGRQLYGRPEAYVDWLGPDAVLSLPVLAAGTAVRVDLTTGRQTVLGEVPARVHACVNTADRLVCPGPADLRLYRLSG